MFTPYGAIAPLILVITCDLPHLLTIFPLAFLAQPPPPPLATKKWGLPSSALALQGLATWGASATAHMGQPPAAASSPARPPCSCASFLACSYFTGCREVISASAPALAFISPRCLKLWQAVFLSSTQRLAKQQGLRKVHTVVASESPAPWRLRRIEWPGLVCQTEGDFEETPTVLKGLNAPRLQATLSS